MTGWLPKSGVNLFTNTSSGIAKKFSTAKSAIEIAFQNKGGVIAGIGAFNFSNLKNSGKVLPGTPVGSLTINSSDNPLSTSSELQIEIQNTGTGTINDRLRVDQNLILNGRLLVTEIGSIPNGSYLIISALDRNTISGNFSTTQLPPGYRLRIQNRNSVWLDKTTASTPLQQSNMGTAKVEKRIADENQFTGAVSFYPNPANHTVNVRINNGFAKGNLRISLVDRLGRLLNERIHNYAGGKDGVTLNTSTITNGLYFVVVRDRTGKEVVVELIIQH